MFEKDLNMSYLLDFYGDILPERQRRMLEMYYNEDLSLSEIAEEFAISRQGTRHDIKKGEKQLLFLEEKLSLAQKHRDLAQAAAQIAEKLSKLSPHMRDTDKTVIDEIVNLASKLSQEYNT